MDVNLDIRIPKNCIEKIEERSTYNNVFYKIKIRGCGDWFWGKLDVLYQYYDEVGNCCEYCLGYIDENDKFHRIVCWISDYDVFDI